MLRLGRARDLVTTSVLRSEGQYKIVRCDLANETFTPIGNYDSQALHLVTSRDGQVVAIADAVGNLKLWQLNDGPRPYAMREAFTGRVAGLDFSPDGMQLLAGDQKNIKIWDTESKELIHTWTPNTDFMYCLAWSPDGKKIATAGYGPDITLWNANDMSEIGRISVPDEGTLTLTFSPDSKRLVAGTYSPGDMPAPGQVIVCDVPTRTIVKSLSGHRISVYDIAVTPNGKRILSASNDGSVRIWSMPPE